MTLTWDWREIRKSLKKRDKVFMIGRRNQSLSSSITNEPSPSPSVPLSFSFITTLIIYTIETPHSLFS